MTENSTEDEMRAETYRITSIKVTEVDFTAEEKQMILEQTGAESVEDAIKTVVRSRQKSSVKAAEKLVSQDVDVA